MRSFDATLTHQTSLFYLSTSSRKKSIKQSTHVHFRTKLASLYPKLAPLVQDEENLTLALNEEYVDVGEVKQLSSGDTVALIPPISGG